MEAQINKRLSNNDLKPTPRDFPENKRETKVLRATILIKSDDQYEYLEQTFPIISQQTEQNHEVILLYSGHSEKTVELAKRWNAQVIRIKPEEFSHPRALNIGSNAASGLYIVCLSADAIPASSLWLESLLKYFEIPDVAGVYGRHLPGRNANLFDYHRSWLWYGSKSKILTYEVGHPFSNANSAIRKSLWEQHHFDESLDAVEDYEWALWAQAHGYKIIYSAEAAVFHSHAERYGFLGYLSRAMLYKRIRAKIDERNDYPLVTSIYYFLAIAISLAVLAMIALLNYEALLTDVSALLLSMGPIAILAVASIELIIWANSK